MDPFSIISLTFSSIKYTKEGIMKTRRFIHRWNNAPASIATTKTTLDSALKTLEILERGMSSISQDRRLLETTAAVLSQTRLKSTLLDVQNTCEHVNAKFASLMSHSNDEKLSKRDRAYIAMREKAVLELNRELHRAQSAMSECLVQFQRALEHLRFKDAVCKQKIAEARLIAATR